MALSGNNTISYRCSVCGASSDNLNEAKIHAKIHRGSSFTQLYGVTLEQAELAVQEKTATPTR